ncbi:hypothetical protein NQ318_002790 [Aromia moschata]|uniref:Bifunctional coenzyme A synthase n=1 Tax=Aromia moschata TaxID=1265417 RepID=A0AAV8XT43_9CUCU|nr:hypothetical protein NQ318_002790 [Aromia moschata]
MLAKTGLLIVSNPKQIGTILESVQKLVKNTLYIQLLSAISEPFGNFYSRTVNPWPEFSKTIYNIYAQAATHCYNLDVKVLISGIKYNIPKIQTQQPIDLVIFDKTYSQSDIDNFIKSKVHITNEYDVLTLDSGSVNITDEHNSNDDIVCKHAVLGGTFDRLHLAHKLLLSEAVLRSSEKLTVGVTDETMLESKLLPELIEDMDVRINNVKLEYHFTPISDPFGPAIVDPTMELIVVSKETIRGGEKINEQPKISSSTRRIRLLGTVLRPITPNDSIPKTPYVIGLTGGIASGKSGVAKWLSELDVEIINCDLIGHGIYKLGKPCHKALVDHFGSSVVADDGEIDRKVLGTIVFSDPEQLKKLNSLVWPAIIEEVQEIIRNTDKKVVVVEAAILLNASWHKSCHEVWTTLVPRKEAIKRLLTRNGLTEEEALKRINAQQPNSFYVKNANVVFCPLWEPEYTKDQVTKAWNLLQQRLP